MRGFEIKRTNAPRNFECARLRLAEDLFLALYGIYTEFYLCMINLVREHQSQKHENVIVYNNRNLKVHPSITCVSIHHTHVHMPNACDTLSHTYSCRYQNFKCFPLPFFA